MAAPEILQGLGRSRIAAVWRTTMVLIRGEQNAAPGIIRAGQDKIQPCADTGPIHCGLPDAAPAMIVRSDRPNMVAMCTPMSSKTHGDGVFLQDGVAKSGLSHNGKKRLCFFAKGWRLFQIYQAQGRIWWDFHVTELLCAA